jgi:thiol:disulfide interchange protein
MIRILTLISFLFLFSISLSAQIYDPVKWEFGYEAKGSNTYELIFTAIIDDNSHIYSMDIPSGGPIPTSFIFDTIPGLTLVEKPYEVTKPEEIFDKAFGLKIKTFTKRAEFRQKITSNTSDFIVTGLVNYMSCDNTRCSPPKDVEFSIKIGTPVLNNRVAGQALPSTYSDKGGLLKFFLLALLAGFAGVVTPCVFPMIPMTVVFFSRGTESRSRSIVKALAFGISIIIIYTTVGIIVSLTSAGAGFASTLSTHWVPNAIFFLLFIFFSVSFFGAFEIILPSAWVSRADSNVDRGGVFASFFMALTTVLVAFSCTGPIIGVLLVEAARGEVLRPAIGMFGFGLAFALPFTIFALFPSILNRLPKSGGWLNSIKVVLAFIMLAFSMKFLATIDSVYSLGILNREVFLAIWITIFSLLGFYLMGKIKFSHDSDIQHIGPFRLLIIITVFSFVIYLVTGLFGAPLKGISALLPEKKNSGIDISGIGSDNKQVVNTFALQPVVSELCSTPKYGDFLFMPLGLEGYFEYNQGLACAREKGKPVLFDFKGHACSNCKEMEARVWSDPRVLTRLKENFVIVALYADDRTKLPDNEWVESKVDGKIKKTMGKVNEDIEISKFMTNALPLYVITDQNGNALNSPMGTNFNVEEYIKWLDEGAGIFQNLPNLKVIP